MRNFKIHLDHFPFRFLSLSQFCLVKVLSYTSPCCLNVRVDLCPNGLKRLIDLFRRYHFFSDFEHLSSKDLETMTWIQMMQQLVL